jgi:hypothetical protein
MRFYVSNTTLKSFGLKKKTLVKGKPLVAKNFELLDLPIKLVNRFNRALNGFYDVHDALEASIELARQMQATAETKKGGKKDESRGDL